MESAKQRALGRTLVLLDVLAVAASLALAYLLHSQLRQYVDELKPPPTLASYLPLSYLAIPLWPMLNALVGQYSWPGIAGGVWKSFLALVKSHVAGTFAVGLLLYLAQLPLNRSVVLMFVAISLTLMTGLRAALQAGLRLEHRLGHAQLRVLLISKDDALPRISHTDTLSPLIVGRLSLTATTDAKLPQNSTNAVPCIGGLDQLESTLHQQAIDLVITICSDLDNPGLPGILEHCDRLGVAFRLSPGRDSRLGNNIRAFDEFGLPCLAFGPKPRSPEALVAKRLLDLLGAGAAILLFSPVMLLAAILILLTMGRPLLIRQRRNGLNGRAFTMFKFRTMVADAEDLKAELLHANEAGGPVFKIARDPRITPLGRILRKSSIDEMPQLFNVVTGSMSLVGPRPLPVAEQQQITGELRRRLSMKPGITGLWQVSGRSDIGFEDWMKLDLEYVDNWSLLQDLKLLVRTIPAVLMARGAK